MLQSVEMRHDLLRPELVGRAGDRLMLGGEFLRREDVTRLALFDEERAAFDRSHYCSHSKIPAAPCPPPTHMVTMPYFDLRRAISRRIVAVNLAPVQPSGCPSAIAPPLTLTRAGSMPASRITARACTANASLSSMTSIVSNP